MATGSLSVALGDIGIVVPGLSTTVFFIVAAACFARCNPRFERWVLDLHRIGPQLRDHRSLEGCTVSPDEVASSRPAS